MVYTYITDTNIHISYLYNQDYVSKFDMINMRYYSSVSFYWGYVVFALQNHIFSIIWHGLGLHQEVPSMNDENGI